MTFVPPNRTYMNMLQLESVMLGSLNTLILGMYIQFF